MTTTCVFRFLSDRIKNRGVTEKSRLDIGSLGLEPIICPDAAYWINPLSQQEVTKDWVRSVASISKTQKPDKNGVNRGKTVGGNTGTYGFGENCSCHYSATCFHCSKQSYWPRRGVGAERRTDSRRLPRIHGVLTPYCRRQASVRLRGRLLSGTTRVCASTYVW